MRPLAARLAIPMHRVHLRRQEDMADRHVARAWIEAITSQEPGLLPVPVYFEGGEPRCLCISWPLLSMAATAGSAASVRPLARTRSPWRCSTSGVRHATGPGCQGQTAMAASMSVWARHPMPRISPAPEPVPCRSHQHSAALALHNVCFRGHWLYDGLFSGPLAPFPTRKDTPHVSREGRHCGPHVA